MVADLRRAPHAHTIARYLLLRDRLRADAADRALYESTKTELMRRRWDDMNDYADAKTEVIAAIIARARGRTGTGPSSSTP